MSNPSPSVKVLREAYIEHAYRAAELAGIEAPSREAFKRDPRNPTRSSWQGLLRSMAQGACSVVMDWTDPVLGFERFVAAVGPRPAWHCLARRNTKEPWSAANAMWAERERHTSTGRPPQVVREVRRRKAERFAEENGLDVRHFERDAKNYLYRTWTQILARCNDCLAISYRHYGERGIKLHDEWDDGCTWGFEAFVAYILSKLGDRPEGHTLDRRDNEGHYEPGNVQWATAAQQAANRRPGRPRKPKGSLEATTLPPAA
jgi:hypothetical protein